MNFLPDLSGWKFRIHSVFIIEKGEWKINHLLSWFDKVRMIQLQSQILLNFFRGV